jgi:hypothetical protein
MECGERNERLKDEKLIKRNDDGRGKMRIDIKRQITDGH